MHLQEAAYTLNKVFQYRPDRPGLDPWHILDTRKESARGNCEDYIATILWLISDKRFSVFLRNLLFGGKNVVFHYCTIVEDGRRGNHTVLEYKKEYIDNILGIRSDRGYYTASKYKHSFKHPWNRWVILFRLFLGTFIGR